MKKQLKAILFLSIISVVMLHNAFPHVHHGHEEVVTEKNHHHHHDKASDHHHHSDDQKPAKESHKNLLSFLLDNHTHTFHSHEYPEFVRYNSKVFSDKDLTAYTIANSLCINFQGKQNKKSGWRLYSPPFNEHFNPLSRSLRAPPSLG